LVDGLVNSIRNKEMISREKKEDEVGNKEGGEDG
jgi:hypothetical protein